MEKKQGTWAKDASFRIKNRKWLRYSHNISRRILAIIKDDDELKQKKLAEKIGVTPQRISRIVSGKENLTLETIAQISEALGVELISFPEYKHSKPILFSNEIIENFIDVTSKDIAANIYSNQSSLYDAGGSTWKANYNSSVKMQENGTAITA